MASHNNFKSQEQDGLDISPQKGQAISFEELKPEWREFCSFYRQYPDLFLDLIKDKNSHFNLYPYQRLMLRILFRYKKVYMTFTRGTAKSFTQILALFLRCIMYPKIKLFISAPRKEQAAKISKENLDDILTFFPILKNEINWKASKFEKDYTKIVTMNGSRLDVVQVSNAARGGRKQLRLLSVMIGNKITLTAGNSLELY